MKFPFIEGVHPEALRTPKTPRKGSAVMYDQARGIWNGEVEPITRSQALDRAIIACKKTPGRRDFILVYVERNGIKFLTCWASPSGMVHFTDTWLCPMPAAEKRLALLEKRPKFPYFFEEGLEKALSGSHNYRSCLETMQKAAHAVNSFGEKLAESILGGIREAAEATTPTEATQPSQEAPIHRNPYLRAAVTSPTPSSLVPPGHPDYPTPKPSGAKYLRTIRDISGTDLPGQVDVYSVLEAFKVTSPPLQHAIKKLLCAGLRNKGSREQDVREAKDALDRYLNGRGYEEQEG